MDPLRIAVADDEKDMRDYFQRVLERRGHQVLGPVANGLELVELCRVERPDLIITDIRMPELDGHGALRRILKECPVPYIVVSACGVSTEADREAAKLGGFLHKPIRIADLEQAIGRVMTGAGGKTTR